MALTFSVADLTIHRIIEQETTFLPAREIFPELTPEMLDAERSALQAANALDAQDTLIRASNPMW